MASLTSVLRPFFLRRAKASARFASSGDEIQRSQLRKLLKAACETEYGRKHHFKSIAGYDDFRQAVPLVRYEDIRADVMRMVAGEKNVLWRGVVRHFAQSSGTSDGKSKYIPISNESFSQCHYRGGFDCVAHYLALNPDSRIFDGKAFILGGSYANALSLPRGVVVGDLSANLISRINPAVNLLRVPDKRTALMEDWSLKLPALVEASRRENVTNISGVPSWFLSVLKEVMKAEGVGSIHEVWPNLEVFFHGGISFRPYRQQYEAITDSKKMHFLETYNASEGFFAVQSSWDTAAMLLLLDLGVFYEFIPLSETGKDNPQAISIRDVEAGHTYELVGEELMVYNADAAIEKACARCGAEVANYTAAPVYATATTKGRHEWLIEFAKRPADMDLFAETLDKCLRDENSDYDAKRFQGIFIDRLSIVEARHGLFDDWLSRDGGKLGGQRKIPRLYNSRDIMESMLKMNH